MKRLSGFLFTIALLLGGYYLWYHQNYSTQEYYTKITTNGERINVAIKNGKETYPHYRYHLNAYNQKNEKKEVEFNSVDSVPLKKDAYLVLHVNKKKGVIGWEEVKASKVPSIIINTLNHEASQQ
ncbi:YxeA family protein [Enterococcus avium]|uniref:YxeA family protein n=1 Tax=Enterococcus avium TaxID=33945 RepID=UPI00159E94C7|nr:YxeA family protein [Enterococcus avium]NVN75888.1 YxeA family protein [Enterococcus avium]